MEITAQLFRALSSKSRLQILRLLAVLGEQKVSTIARAASRQQPGVSVDLRVLATSGLVWRRRSGRSIYYRLVDSPARPATGRVLDMLRRVFRNMQAGEPKAVIITDQENDELNSDAALMRWFGAFAYPRRLQIIRCLSSEGPGTVPTLAEKLSMSPAACRRHLAKLSDSGLLRTAPGAGCSIWWLAPCADSARRKVVRAVIEQLAGPEG
jgi:DNA-binding transcriptional ArsR family regulator